MTREEKALWAEKIKTVFDGWKRLAIDQGLMPIALIVGERDQGKADREGREPVSMITLPMHGPDPNQQWAELDIQSDLADILRMLADSLDSNEPPEMINNSPERN